jgi:GR25 family glycosyltransferase involved in LPS biosynthesis
MKAYMISLNDSTEKIDYLKSFGIETVLVKGVNGKTIPDEEIVKRVSNTYKTFGPKGAIGCAISHMNTWKMFLETNDEYAIIFEDDVILEDNFNEKLKLALEDIPKNYDILYLGCAGCDEEQKFNAVKFIATLFMSPKTFNPPQKISDHISIPSVALCTHAYIVSRRGATKLLDQLDGKINNHIDICIQNLVLDNQIESYSVTPRVAYQTSTDDNQSENVSSNYPLIATSVLNKIYVDKLFKAQYLFTVSAFRIGNFNINGFTILFFIIGILCMLKGINIRIMTIVFLFISSPDIVLSKNLYDVQVVLFHYFVLMLPILLKKIIVRGKNLNF